MKIPDSLVLLTQDLLNETDLSIFQIEKMEWFLFRKKGFDLIFLSAEEVERVSNCLIETTIPEDCGLTTSDFLARVPDHLKRWDDVVGFYSA